MKLRPVPSLFNLLGREKFLKLCSMIFKENYDTSLTAEKFHKLADLIYEHDQRKGVRVRRINKKSMPKLHKDDTNYSENGDHNGDHCGNS